MIRWFMSIGVWVRIPTTRVTNMMTTDKHCSCRCLPSLFALSLSASVPGRSEERSIFNLILFDDCLCVPTHATCVAIGWGTDVQLTPLFRRGNSRWKAKDMPLRIFSG